MFLERVYLTEINNDSKPKGLEIDDEEIISASSGSGFFVSKEGHIITNFHVIDNCNVVKVNFKGKQVNTKIFAIDKKNDLAIIQTDINPSKVFPVSNNDVTLLQDVIVAGYPLGKNISSAIKMHKGSVTALTGYEDNYSNFQTDATINQGNSGGPIIDKYGNVVGIAVATWVEQGVQGIHFGIKSSVLKTFANSKELNFLPPNRKEISEKKLGELISDSTIYLECWMTGAKIKKMIAKADSKKAFFSKFK
jgi:serine protease Do